MTLISTILMPIYLTTGGGDRNGEVGVAAPPYCSRKWGTRNDPRVGQQTAIAAALQLACVARRCRLPQGDYASAPLGMQYTARFPS